MKKKLVSALLLGMAVSMTTPAISVIAEETEVAASPEPELPDPGDVPNSQEDGGGEETGEETGSEENSTKVGEAEVYTEQISDVIVQLKRAETSEEENPISEQLQKFSEVHMSEYKAGEDFLDAFLSTLEKQDDKVSVVKAFGSVYGNQMDVYVMGFIRESMQSRDTDKERCDLYLQLLELEDTQEGFWNIYSEWKEELLETEEPPDRGTYAQSGGEDHESGGTLDTVNSEGDSGTDKSDSDTSGNDQNEPPANADSAVEELTKLDYSSLSPMMQEKVKKMIEDSIHAVNSCSTEEEVTEILEAAKIALKNYMEEDLLNTRIEVAVNELKQFRASLMAVDEETKSEIEKLYDIYAEELKKAGNKEEIANILDEAKKKMKDLAEGTGDVLIEAKNTAVSELAVLKETVTDRQTAGRVSALFAEMIENALNKGEVEKYASAAYDSMSKLKAAVDQGGADSYTAFLDSLKILCAGTEDRGLLEYIKVFAIPEAPVQAVSDMLTALENTDTALYKKALLNELGSMISKLPDKEKEQAVAIESDASDAMARAADKKEAYIVYENALDQVSTINASGEVLNQKIKENLAKLDGLSSPDTEEAKELLRIYKEKITHAISVEEADRLLEEAKTEMEALKKKHEEVSALKSAKEKAYDQIDNFLRAITDTGLKEQILRLCDSTKKEIENASSASDVSVILSKFKEDARTITKEYAADKTLTEKKTAIIQKITDIVNGKEMSSDLYSLYVKVKEDVMAAATTAEIDTLYTNFVKTFNEKMLTSLREKYYQKLTDLIETIDPSSAKYTEISTVIAKARENISRTSSEELMEKIFSQTKTNIEALSSQSEEQNSLDLMKTNAINELRLATSLTTSTAQKVISVYSNKIQNATTEGEVSQVLAEGKALLQKLNEAAGVNADGTSEYGSAGDTLVNGATMNKADGSAGNNTTYSSTAKEDPGSGLKGDVKTGDENGFKIVALLSSMIVGLCVVGLIVFKKIKKK